MVVCGLALGAGTTDARADYIPSNAPYTKPANDIPWGAKLSPGSSWWSGGSWWDPQTPQVPGETYPGAWSKGSNVLTSAGRAGRFLPALRVLGNISLLTTGAIIGWKIGTPVGGFIYQQLTGAPYGSLPAGSYEWMTGPSGPGWDTSGSPYTWALYNDSTGPEYCWPNGPYTPSAWNIFGHAAPGTEVTTGNAAGTVCAAAGVTRVKLMTAAQMEGEASTESITAAQYGAIPTGQQRSTGTYTPPTTTSGDLAASRAVMGNPVAGKNGSGQWVDASGNVLTPGQVVAQSAANCSLDASYCTGGANDPAAPGAPLSDVAVMPSCTGSVVAVCVGQLDAAGFSGARTFTTLDLDGANVTLPAGAVVTQNHAAGSSVTKTLPLTFTINPALADMPLVLPSPLISETHAAYLLRLQTLGYVGTMTSTDLSEVTGNPALGPNTIVRMTVTTGTGTVTPIETPSFPATPVRVRKDSPITVQSNPATFTPVAGAGTPVGGAADPGAGTCDCTVRAINWAPLMGLSAGDRFPFGLWTWLSGGISGWASSSGAPAFDLPLYGAGSGRTVHVDLAPFGAIAALWRAALTVLVTVLAIWNFASRQAGDGEGEGI